MYICFCVWYIYIIFFNLNCVSYKNHKTEQSYSLRFLSPIFACLITELKTALSFYSNVTIKMIYFLKSSWELNPQPLHLQSDFLQMHNTY